MTDTDIQHTEMPSESTTEDDGFPPHVDPTFRAALRERPDLRRTYYTDLIRQHVFNSHCKSNGIYSFIITPETFERLMDQIEHGSARQPADVIQALREMYYKGTRPNSVGTKARTCTLSHHLRAAEEALDILKCYRDSKQISLRTIKMSYRVLRYARDANLDLSKFRLVVL